MSGARRNWLADIEATSRRLTAEYGLSDDAFVVGEEECANGCGRWCLPTNRNQCEHNPPVCNDCYPNGCERCEWQEHETLMHREQATNRILSAVLEARLAADDLSETELRTLGPIPRADVLRHTEQAIEKLTFVRDLLRHVQRDADQLRERM